MVGAGDGDGEEPLDPAVEPETGLAGMRSRVLQKMRRAVSSHDASAS